MFGVEISYNRTLEKYTIDFGEQLQAYDKIADAFKIFRAIKQKETYSNHVFFENRRPDGINYISYILRTIENRKQLHFTYRKFWDEKPSQRKTEPYALQEFNNRWYLLARDLKDNCIKNFALDRISEPEKTNHKFTFPEDLNVEEKYKHCFGIICPDNEEPQEVILSFTPHQGKYILTMPLHPSQEVIRNTAEELRIRLHVYVTHDLFMEIRSHGQEVKVLAPEYLQGWVTGSLKETLARYE